MVLLAGQGDKKLEPGAVVAIYGSALGPETICEAAPSSEVVRFSPPGIGFRFSSKTPVYPKELCGVRVMIGEIAAGVAHVQREQVNFQVPPDMPFTIRAPVRVIYQGVSSDPVLLQFELNTVFLAQEEPAYTGMPVWIRVHAKGAHTSVGYPFSLDPLGHPCREIEVRKDGVKLPSMQPRNKKREDPGRGGVVSGNICGGFPWLPDLRSGRDRLPLHLLYRFDQPGTYEVRYWQPAGAASGFAWGAREGSDWTQIEVQAADSGLRSDWLRKMAMSAPAERADLISDFLPALMGYDDRNALQILVTYLHNPDQFVRAYTMRGLADYFDLKTVVEVVQDESRRQGKNQETEALLKGFEALPIETH